MKSRDASTLPVPARNKSIEWLQRFLALLSILILSGATPAVFAATGAVATTSDLATTAGENALKAGGNAIDAAIAAALTLGVVDGHNSGIGGGCFMLIRRANGQVVAIDGRETAPAAANKDMFVRNGKADVQLSLTGALSVATPGALAAYAFAATNFGNLPLSNHLNTAASLAETGFGIPSAYAERLRDNEKELESFYSSKAVFFDNESGKLFSEGHQFTQFDLAFTYRSIATHGVDWFYQGTFANAVGDWMRGNKGIVTANDLRRYAVKVRPPVRSTYRGYEIIGFPPPSSGGYHVAQILNTLETFDLKSLGVGSPEFVHLVAEAMKLAFADRAFWLGDPDFTKVPAEITGKDYGKLLASKIKRERATKVAGHSDPSAIDKKHTTHFSTTDAEGNWVACTATINTTFGSKAVIPGTGVILNNEMDDFSIQPGATNYFGLLGSEANSVAPFKRPLSSMSPTIVLRNGKPVAALGAAGGPTIISQVVLSLIYMIDFDMSPEAASRQFRFHHQWHPDELKIETAAGGAVVDNLTKRGHKVVRVPALGAAQIVGLTNEQNAVSVRDPRVPR